jgi:CrcB protein
VALVGVGGVGGALLRNAVLLAWPAPSNSLPWATLTVNLTGSLVLGALLALLAVGFPRARLWRLLVGSGFIGAYTTFSTWMVETSLLLRSDRPGLAATYLGLSLAGGIGAVVLGALLARGLVRLERALKAGSGG